MNLVLGQTVVARRYRRGTVGLLWLAADRQFVGQLATVVELFAGNPELVRLQFDGGLQTLWAATACQRLPTHRTCVVCHGPREPGDCFCPACHRSWTALLRREGVQNPTLLEPAAICRWAIARAVGADGRRRARARAVRVHTQFHARTRTLRGRR